MMKLIILACFVFSVQSAIVNRETIANMLQSNALVGERKLTDVIYETSGSIKLGAGGDFDRSGRLIKPGSRPKLASPDVSGNSIIGVMPKKIHFPFPTIKNQQENQSAFISFPATVMAPAYKQKPIVLVPEMIYPRLKRRVVVHHNRGFAQSFQNMAYSPAFYSSMLNESFSQLAKSPIKEKFENYPYFKQFKRNN